MFAPHPFRRNELRMPEASLVSMSGQLYLHLVSPSPQLPVLNVTVAPDGLSSIWKLKVTTVSPDCSCSAGENSKWVCRFWLAVPLSGHSVTLLVPRVRPPGALKLFALAVNWTV